MSPSEARFSASAQNRVEVSPFRPLAPWAVVTVLGTVLAIAGGWSAQRHQSGISRTALVVAQLQADAQALGTHGTWAAQGDPTAIDKLRAVRNRVGVAMALLERGGYAAKKDPAPVWALDGRSGFPMAQARQGLADFDARARALEESGGQLREAAQAATTLGSALKSIGQALDNVARTPALREGGWGAALAEPVGVLSRPEMGSMRVIFSPLPGAETLQGSWARQFGQTAARLMELDRQAQRDANLSGSQRAHVRALAEASQALAASSAMLAQAQPARLAAQQQQAPLLAAATAFEAPLTRIGAQLLAAQATPSWGQGLVWTGWALALAGLTGGARRIRAISRAQAVAAREQADHPGAQMALERISNRLVRALDPRRAAGEPDRLAEDPDSPAFGLATAINRLLDDRARLLIHRDRMEAGWAALLAESVAPARRLSGAAERAHEQANHASQLSHGQAQSLAELAAAPAAARAQRMMEITAAAELLMQEGAVRMDTMRGTVQGTAKRLKRLAESAQSIEVARSAIENISRQVKVLSTNAAIEAAAHGEKGRPFAVLAREGERLSQAASEASEDIGRVVQAIQAEAQETVAAMETSTAEVVASTTLTARAGGSLRDLERQALDLVKDLERSGRQIEQQALTGSRLSKHWDETAAWADGASKDVAALQSILERARQLPQEGAVSRLT